MRRETVGNAGEPVNHPGHRGRMIAEMGVKVRDPLPFHLPRDQPELSGMDGFYAARLVRKA